MFNDPRATFDWPNLHCNYDKKARQGFNPKAECLGIFDPRPGCDRELYAAILRRAGEKERGEGVSLDTYKAMLYWKLYSSGLNALRMIEENAANRDRTRESLSRLGSPCVHGRDMAAIMDCVNALAVPGLLGMQSACRFAVRTTFLHFICPDVVPIVDRMVLKAVGLLKEKQNGEDNINKEMVGDYISYAWCLAEKYANTIKGIRRDNETVLRVIDMALWVNRGE